MTDQENDILWKSYFYPGTNVLKNNLNIKDYNKLKEADATLVFEKLLKLREHPLDMENDKDKLNALL